MEIRVGLTRKTRVQELNRLIHRNCSNYGGVVI